ncbi:MAG: NUDIX domain-containing protein [Candidatus Micrarchaeaceae archaeon]
MYAVKPKRITARTKGELATSIKRGSAVATTKRSFLCYVSNGSEVLMLKGSNGWSAIGDKISSGESPKQAAARKVYELTGLVLDSLVLLGELFIVYEQASIENELVFVLYSREFSGKKKDSVSIAWLSAHDAFSVHSEADRLWLPLLFNEKRFRAEFYFDSPSSNKLIKYNVEKQ